MSFLLRGSEMQGRTEAALLQRQLCLGDVLPANNNVYIRILAPSDTPIQEFREHRSLVRQCRNATLLQKVGYGEEQLCKPQGVPRILLRSANQGFDEVIRNLVRSLPQTFADKRHYSVRLSESDECGPVEFFTR